MASYLPDQAISGFADDFHIQWSITSPRDLSNACTQLVRVLQDLETLGMQVSMDKTAVLLALAGTEAPKMLQTYTSRTPQGRVFKISHPTRTIQLPLKQQHTYLGVIISYRSFERYTLRYRQQLAWQAFHRMRKFLANARLPLPKRVQLWRSCVFSILSYGLTATGLDLQSATQLRGAVMRQLRITAHSLGHLTHEDNTALLTRLGLPDPVESLQRACQQRIEMSRQHVLHLQPPRVQQWWGILCSTFAQLAHPRMTDHASTTLTEVTQVLRIQSTCSICGQQFPSLHALRVHVGKQHQDQQQPVKERNPTIKNKRRDEFRIHSLNGLPTCKHCRKSFHGWPAFMGHFSQQACPVLHGQQTAAPSTANNPTPTAPVNASQPQQLSTQMLDSSIPVSQPSAIGVFAPGGQTGVEPDVTPVFHRPALQLLAKQKDVEGLAQAMRTLDRLKHCPECNQQVTHPKYITRHACKTHSRVRELQPWVDEWLSAHSYTRSPCRWCALPFATRPATHLQSCSVLWACGHMLARHSTLQDSTQPTIQDAFRAARRGTAGRASGTGKVLRVHEADSDGSAVHTGLNSPVDEDGGTGGPSGDGSDGTSQAPLPGAHGRPSASAGSAEPGHPAEVSESRRQRRQQRRRDSSASHGGSRAPRQGGGRQADGAPRSTRQGTRAGQAVAGHTAARPSPTTRHPEPELEGPGEGQLELGTPVPAVAKPIRPPGGRSAEAREPGDGAGPTPRDQGAQEHREGDGSFDIEARGSHRRRHAGQRVLSLSPDGFQRQRMERDPEAVHSCNRVESDAREIPAGDHAAVALRAVARVPHRLDEPGDSHRDEPSAFASSQRPRIAPGRELLLPSVGPPGTAPPQGTTAAPRPRDPEAMHSVDDATHRVSEHGGQLSSSSKDDSRAQLGGAALCAGHSESQPGGSPDVSVLPEADEKLQSALGWSHNAASQVGQITSSQLPGQDVARSLRVHPSQVLNVAFLNPGNWCYANSAVHSLLWAAACSRSGLPMPNLQMLRVLGWACHKPQHVALWKLRPWCALTQQWAQPHRQHDAGEFLQFLGGVFASGTNTDHWQARLMREHSSDAQVADHGKLFPLILQQDILSQHASSTAAECAPCSLQKLVVAWRNQATRHAVVTLPAVLPVQIGRFNDVGDKIRFPIRFSPAVYIPYFPDATTSTSSCRYRLVAAVYHLGHSKHSGHYRAAFFSSGVLTHVADDGTFPVPATEADIQEVQSNAYIIMLCRDDQQPEACRRTGQAPSHSPTRGF